MKRIIALLFAIMMLMTQVCLAAPANGEAEALAAAEAEAEDGVQDVVVPVGRGAAFLPSWLSALMTPDLEHLTVGNPNPIRGFFFTDLWGNITSDQDVRNLLHAYNLVYWDSEEGMFAYDPSVVSGITVTENPAGDRTYTFVLYDDLIYSDGTPITAWDYAFSMLLQIAPEMAELGATPARKPQLLGYQDYINGTVPYLAGLRVTADNTLAITIDNEYLPFFYEMALVSLNPYPISVIAPGVEVRDDGNGVYLANADDTVTEPVFTAELLQETILDPVSGYLGHPSVVSGPYTLTSWDGEKVEFEINPNYKGNVKGQRPTVQTLTYQYADNSTMILDLKKGKYDLLNKVMSSTSIEEGMALVTNDKDLKDYGMSNYPRVGMSYVSFACEKPELEDAAVRQAIAWCMDRDKIMEEYTGNYGIRVDGYYGVGQWLYSVANHTLDVPLDEPAEGASAEEVAAYEEKVAEAEALSLDELVVYEVDTEKAASLLEEAGWTLNDEGIREKKITVVGEDGQEVEETLTLDLSMIYPEGNRIVDSFQEHMVSNLEEVGIRVTMEPKPMSEILTEFYNPEYRVADMIFLASNFDTVFDPSAYFTEVTDEETGEVSHVWTNTGLADEELYNATVAMRETEPGDVLTYTQHWLDFQARFNEVLPMVPIYSNIYFDFYTDFLHDYNIQENISWSDAIVSSYMSDEVPEEETEAEGEGAEGAEGDGAGAEGADAGAEGETAGEELVEFEEEG